MKYKLQRGWDQSKKKKKKIMWKHSMIISFTNKQFMGKIKQNIGKLNKETNAE